MKIDVSKGNGVTVITPMSGRIDIEVAGELRAALLNLIASGDRYLVVDLAAVSFIDSSGLGAFVSAFKALKTRNGEGDIRLANPQTSVVELLEIIRLNRVFSAYPSVEQAAGSFLVAERA
jgi:anti-sigma B factor antagonist